MGKLRPRGQMLSFQIRPAKLEGMVLIVPCFLDYKLRPFSYALNHAACIEVLFFCEFFIYPLGGAFAHVLELDSWEFRCEEKSARIHSFFAASGYGHRY